ncbi:hypothetical protein FEM48_Zijuj09G0078700 [Ziziphus jujuba var. spinosa]|uniref:Response regulatory domain-containing protein n=1 Tax=Ziziphus jujuba var. spinosa TaxID=714518 RepID=A0A978URR8_ZIZJJ|nr:hypothetical protein FEM48_Zijuj09G0078700 [Ziziphus jujuba var. spinosa]
MEKGSASASGSSSSSGSGSATSTTTTTKIMEKGSASASGSDSSSATTIVLEKSSASASGSSSSSATSMAEEKGSGSGSRYSSSSASATSTTTTKIMEKGSGSGSATSTTKINSAIRALVVDDDTLVRKLHGRILEKEFKIEDCIQGKDGKQAVDIHTDGQKFDLILMDSQMPNMDGIQATKNLREMGIASLIIGVSSEENAEQRFKEAGANSYVQKPLTADKLKPILEEFKLI